MSKFINVHLQENENYIEPLFEYSRNIGPNWDQHRRVELASIFLHRHAPTIVKRLGCTVPKNLKIADTPNIKTIVILCTCVSN